MYTPVHYFLHVLGNDARILPSMGQNEREQNYSGSLPGLRISTTPAPCVLT